jgi:hypothetical protein
MRIRTPANQSLTFQALEDSGQRARVNVQQLGEMARWNSGKPADDPKDQALRAGHTEFSHHALRASLQRMIDLPDQAHEVEHRTELWQALRIDCGVCRFHCTACLR